MEQMRLPFPDCIEALEHGHELASNVQLDGQPPFRRRRGLMGEVLWAGTEPGEVLRSRCDKISFM